MKISLNRYAAFILLAAALFSSCEKGGRDHAHLQPDENESLDGPATKITRIGSLEAVFDLQTMEDHKTMMKLMKISMQHDPSSTHALLLTLSDEGGDPVSDVSVTFRIRTPSGRTLEKQASVISGEGMVHYTADAVLTEKGNYTVTGIVKHPELGGEGTVVFSLPLP